MFPRLVTNCLWYLYRFQKGSKKLGRIPRTNRSEFWVKSFLLIQIEERDFIISQILGLVSIKDYSDGALYETNYCS